MVLRIIYCFYWNQVEIRQKNAYYNNTILSINYNIILCFFQYELKKRNQNKRIISYWHLRGSKSRKSTTEDEGKFAG